MIIKNTANGIEHALNFIQTEIQNYNTSNLIVKFKNIPKSFIKGYCKYATSENSNYVINCGVISNGKYPRTAEYAIGTQQLNFKKGFKWITWVENFKDSNEAMVFLFGHELWHFLCKTKQKKGNHQTKANVFGFEMLNKYRSEYELEKC